MLTGLARRASPIPRIAGTDPIIFTAAQVTDIGLGICVPEGTDHHEEGIAPLPRVVVFFQMIAGEIGIGAFITRVE